MIMFEADSSCYKTVSMLSTCCDGLAIVHLTKHLPSDTLVVVKKFNMDRAKEESHLIQVNDLIFVWVYFNLFDL